VSNAPDISNESRVAIYCLDLQIVWICNSRWAIRVRGQQEGLQYNREEA
jgi:hypothetical protein